jgi:hypothetical protein
MSDDSWTDRIASARMRVDQRFEDRIAASSFNRQQWGLVMTAVNFDIENAGDPEQARLVADTDNLSSVMSQVEEVGKRGGGMGGGMGGRGGGGSSGSGGSSGGIFGTVADALGIGGGGGNSALREEAEELTAEYAEELQKQLEDRGRWQSIRADVADE